MLLHAFTACLLKDHKNVDGISYTYGDQGLRKNCGGTGDRQSQPAAQLPVNVKTFVEAIKEIGTDLTPEELSECVGGGDTSFVLTGPVGRGRFH